MDLFCLHTVPVANEWYAYWSCRFTLRKRTLVTNFIEYCVGPRAGTDDIENEEFLTIPELEPRTFGRPASSYIE
jgi:hypothetical protein